MDTGSLIRPRPHGSRLALILICALLYASPALASRAHEFTGTFGEQCTSESCEEAELKEPSGVAVNEATGDMYVVDKGANRVVRFDKEGVFQSEFNGSGLLLGEETAAGGLGRGGEVETGRFLAPEAIAVDNSCSLRKVGDSELTQEQCEEEDPSNGDVYVVDAGNRVIDKYSPAGKYLGQIAEAGGESFKGEPIDGVAVDPSGAVFVYREHPEIDRFTNGAPNPEGTPNEFIAPRIEVTGLSKFGFGAPAFAIDSTGAFYVLTGFGGEAPGPISKLGPSSGPPPAVLTEELDGNKSFAVSVDQTSNDAFVANATNVGVFNSEGTLLERLGEEEGAKHLSRGAGIGVNASAASVYVADAATGTVAVFGPAQPDTPKVEGESFSAVSSSSAKLEGQLNPRSEPGEAPTEYTFQYGRCADASKCQDSTYEADTPKPDGLIEADFNVHGASAVLTGLLPSSTYHFRVIAKNSHGEGQPGAEVTFATEAGGGPLVLPDGRGWELVSPPEKAGRIEPIAEGNTGGVVQAAQSGEAITYLTDGPTESRPQGYANLIQIISRRAAASWSSSDLTIPHTTPPGLTKGEGPEYKFFDQKLESAAVQPFGQFPPLSKEASEPTAYLQDLGASCTSHCFRPLVTGKAGFANVPEGTVFGEEADCIPTTHPIPAVCGPRFRGATADLSHIVLSSSVALQTGAGPGLYEWSRSSGALAPVSLLPEKEPVAEGVDGSLGLRQQAARRAISTDGSRIVWGAEPDLYSRDMTREETVRLDEATCSAEEGCKSGAGRFQIASSDGSRVFFTDLHRLTKDSSTSGADLYECKITLSAGKLTCELSDLTPKNGEEDAQVQGGVLGASEDGSYVYFVAEGVQSHAPNSREQSAIAGQPNLYVRHGATTSFIATLSTIDFNDWEEGLSRQPTRVSNNGQWLELMSQARPTGYDNRDASTGAPVAEVYLYDAVSNKLRCASCEPTGIRPSGIEYAKIEPGNGGLAGGPRDIWPKTALVAANVPGWTEIGTGGDRPSRHQPRYLSDEGRLFFNSLDALVPQDANATEDVYQYEPPGVGGCSEADTTFSARASGCVALISSGGSAQESAFLDASESGDDVFFLTSAKLSRFDGDTARDVYDAHACPPAGKRPCITFPDVQSPPCTTEASCKTAPTPQPPIFGAPASATFEGPGNLKPASPVVEKVAKKKIVKCAQGKKLKHGKCVHTKTRRRTHRKKRS